jgi:hypothetical protein
LHLSTTLRGGKERSRERSMAEMLRCAECGRRTTDEEETPSPRANGWRLVVARHDLNIVFALCPLHAEGRDELPRTPGRHRADPLTPW